MRMYKANIAYTAVSQSRMSQYTTTSGSWYKKTVTQHVDGYSKPRWYVATPMEATVSGESGQICVTGGAATTTSCDDPAHVAIAGVMFSEWKGGNMPQQEDHVSAWEHSQSSFTIAFFAVVLASVTFGIALVAVPALGFAASVGMAAAAGAAVGAGYAIASTVFGSGGSVTQAQNGIFGATGNGWIQATAPGSEAQRRMVTNIASRFVAPQIGATTMTGTQALFKGACPEGYTVGQCQQASLDPGTTWRPDSYTEYNSTRALRARMAYCTGTLHLSGTAAEQCAAPAAMQY
jgi:hypothetical protein